MKTCIDCPEWVGQQTCCGWKDKNMAATLTLDEVMEAAAKDVSAAKPQAHVKMEAVEGLKLFQRDIPLGQVGIKSSVSRDRDEYFRTGLCSWIETIIQAAEESEYTKCQLENMVARNRALIEKSAHHKSMYDAACSEIRVWENDNKKLRAENDALKSLHATVIEKVKLMAMQKTIKECKEHYSDDEWSGDTEVAYDTFCQWSRELLSILTQQERS